MERLSIFDIYKIGVGPSSSHTLGPWNAATQFAAALWGKDIDHLQVHLYGSLSKTGRGHATDVAVQLGLEGHDPVIIDTQEIPAIIERILREERLEVNKNDITFSPKQDIIFHGHSLPGHPNTLTFKAFYKDELIEEHTYYSLGGGFIEQEGVSQTDIRQAWLPFPIDEGSE